MTNKEEKIRELISEIEELKKAKLDCSNELEKFIETTDYDWERWEELENNLKKKGLEFNSAEIACVYALMGIEEKI